MRHLITLACVAALGVASAQSDETLVFALELASPVGTDGLDTRSIDFVDIDDDTDLDLYACNFNQVNILYTNDGAGNLTAVIAGDPIVTDIERNFDQCFGDVDNDGDMDLFLANGNDQDNSLYINQGNAQAGTAGTFVKETTGAAVTTGGDSYGACFGFLDGDAFLDLVVANRFQDNFLFFGDGTSAGFTQDVVTLAGENKPSRSVSLPDIDDDGDLDIVFANSNGENNAIYVNQGGLQAGTIGTFAKLATGDFVNDGGNSYGVAAADLDGDEDLDLVVANRDEANAVYLNDGVGNFTEDLTSPMTQDAGDSYDVSLCDWDGDGDFDVLIANRVENNFAYLNTGNFTFVKDVDGQVGNDRGDTRGIAAGDLNGDGFLEIAAANTLGGNDFLYDNRGLQWKDLGDGLPGATTPSMFGNGNLVLNSMASLTTTDAPPNTVTNLILGATTVSAPFKGGVLVPSPDIVLPPLPTNANGEQFLQGTIVNPLPSLVTLFLQNWIADPSGPQGLTATNAVSVTTL